MYSSQQIVEDFKANNFNNFREFCLKQIQKYSEDKSGSFFDLVDELFTIEKQFKPTNPGQLSQAKFIYLSIVSGILFDHCNKNNLIIPEIIFIKCVDATINFSIQFINKNETGCLKSIFTLLGGITNQFNLAVLKNKNQLDNKIDLRKAAARIVNICVGASKIIKQKPIDSSLTNQNLIELLKLQNEVIIKITQIIHFMIKMTKINNKDSDIVVFYNDLIEFSKVLTDALEKAKNKTKINTEETPAIVENTNNLILKAMPNKNSIEQPKIINQPKPKNKTTKIIKKNAKKETPPIVEKTNDLNKKVIPNENIIAPPKKTEQPKSKSKTTKVIKKITKKEVKKENPPKKQNPSNVTKPETLPIKKNKTKVDKNISDKKDKPTVIANTIEPIIENEKVSTIEISLQASNEETLVPNPVQIETLRVENEISPSIENKSPIVVMTQQTNDNKIHNSSETPQIKSTNVAVKKINTTHQSQQGFKFNLPIRPQLYFVKVMDCPKQWSELCDFFEDESIFNYEKSVSKKLILTGGILRDNIQGKEFSNSDDIDSVCGMKVDDVMKILGSIHQSQNFTFTFRKSLYVDGLITVFVYEGKHSLEETSMLVPLNKIDIRCEPGFEFNEKGLKTRVDKLNFCCNTIHGVRMKVIGDSNDKIWLYSAHPKAVHDIKNYIISPVNQSKLEFSDPKHIFTAIKFKLRKFNDMNVYSNAVSKASLTERKKWVSEVYLPEYFRNYLIKSSINAVIEQLNQFGLTEIIFPTYHKLNDKIKKQKISTSLSANKLIYNKLTALCDICPDINTARRMLKDIEKVFQLKIAEVILIWDKVKFNSSNHANSLDAIKLIPKHNKHTIFYSKDKVNQFDNKPTINASTTLAKSEETSNSDLNFFKQFENKPTMLDSSLLSKRNSESETLDMNK